MSRKDRNPKKRRRVMKPSDMPVCWDKTGHGQPPGGSGVNDDPSDDASSSSGVDVDRFRVLVLKHFRLTQIARPKCLKNRLFVEFVELNPTEVDPFILALAKKPQILSRAHYTREYDFADLLKYQTLSILKRIVQEYTNQKKCPFGKAGLVKMFSTHFKGGPWAMASREEEGFLLKDEEMRREMEFNFVEMCGVAVPSDLVKAILSFAPHDYALVTGFGLCSWHCYLAVLTSWRHLVISQKNLYFVSKVILGVVTHFQATSSGSGRRTKLRVPDWVYVLKETRNLAKVESLVFESDDHVPPFVSALRKRKVQVCPRMRILDTGRDSYRYSSSSSRGLGRDLSLNHLFPNLVSLGIGANLDSLVGGTDKWNSLEDLRLRKATRLRSYNTSNTHDLALRCLSAAPNLRSVKTAVHNCCGTCSKVLEMLLSCSTLQSLVLRVKRPYYNPYNPDVAEGGEIDCLPFLSRFSLERFRIHGFSALSAFLANPPIAKELALDCDVRGLTESDMLSFLSSMVLEKRIQTLEIGPPNEQQYRVTVADDSRPFLEFLQAEKLLRMPEHRQPPALFASVFLSQSVVRRFRCRCSMVFSTYRDPDQSQRGLTSGLLEAKKKILQRFPTLQTLQFRANKLSRRSPSTSYRRCEWWEFRFQ